MTCLTCGAIQWGNANCATCRFHWAEGDPVVMPEDVGVLGYCPHGVNLDHALCPKGCRV